MGPLIRSKLRIKLTRKARQMSQRIADKVEQFFNVEDEHLPVIYVIFGSYSCSSMPHKS